MMSCKPLLVMMYDYPLSPEGSKAYLAQADRWIKQCLACQGALEWRVYRDADGATPFVTAVTTFDTLEHAQAARSDLAPMWYEARAFGVTGVTLKVLASSPIYPDPIKP